MIDLEKKVRKKEPEKLVEEKLDLENESYLIEVERIEIEKLELEVEIKRLELEKLNKERELKQKAKDEQLLQDTEEIEPIVEIQEETQEEIQLESKDYLALEQRKKNRWFSISVFLITLVMILNAFNVNSEDKRYYDSIDHILEAQDYYMFTYADMCEMYGEPVHDPKNRDRFIYDMGNYSLVFVFALGYVNELSYISDAGFEFRNDPSDVFYLFGLEDDITLFQMGTKDGFVFEAKNDNNISKVTLKKKNNKKNIISEVTINFKPHFSKRKVFEGVFNDVPVVFDLTQIIDKDKEYVDNLLGSSGLQNDDASWTYETEVGELVVLFSAETGKTLVFYILLDEPMKYEASTQEALVMFGVDPTLKSLKLVDFRYDENIENSTSFKSYEIYIDSNSDKICYTIDNISLENKTFRVVAVLPNAEELIGGSLDFE